MMLGKFGSHPLKAVCLIDASSDIMQVENSHDFNQRLSQWIASQGFWFQLRYSMSSGGGWSIAFFHLMRIMMRVGIVLLIVAIGLFIYVFKRTDQVGFRRGVQTSLQSALNAEEVKMEGFNRLQGEAMIRRIGAKGSDGNNDTPQSFFQSLECANLELDMGLLDGLTQPWEAGVVEMNWLDAEIRAGANSPEDAKAMADVLFREYPKFSIQGLDVGETTITWGLKSSTYGGITDSRMMASRAPDGWRMTFEGGQFSQNWIKKFDIEKIVMLLTRDGLVFEEGVLTSGAGKITFDGVKVVGGYNPEVSGNLIFDRVPLSALIPDDATEIVSGEITGNFAVSGSTNFGDGLQFKGQVSLAGTEVISIRSKLPILSALDVVDVFNSYKRVNFEDGQFDVETKDGQMIISKLDMEAHDHMTMQGRIVVRRPTEEEITKKFGEDITNRGFNADVNPAKDEEFKMSLKDAASAASTKKDGGSDGEGGEEQPSFFDKIEENRDIRRAAMDRYSKLYIFEGGVRIMIAGNAFERSRTLRERFPVDQSTGLIGIDVPLQGFQVDLTKRQADEILNLSAID